MLLPTGSSIGPYQIIGWLGAGGMGEVYRARDSRLGRDVAIKVIPTTFAADASRAHRFEQEARAAGQINHPNILAVYDVGIHDGVPYIVSELLEGESLRGRLEGGALASRKVLDYTRQAAEGLAAAHDKGIVHRDLKPDNLFITSDGRVKILDFGIAKLTSEPDETDRRTGAPTDTAPGMVLGTPAYMSPEQVRGGAVDSRSDIFSLGAILHEMLYGRPAFARDTPVETMTAILKEEPGTTTASSIPPALERIASRCLEKAREARFQSARDLAFALEFLSGENPVTAPTAIAVRPWRSAALGGAVVLLGLLAVVAAWLARNTGSPSIENLLDGATITSFTDFEDAEDAAVSPDGKFISFLASRDGVFHVWRGTASSGDFQDITQGEPSQKNTGPLRGAGFSGDASQIWINGSKAAGRRLSLVSIFGGQRRNFLNDIEAVNVAWSPDRRRIVYLSSADGDPLFVADATGENARRIWVGTKGDHNHFPAWSLDGEWIFFARSSKSLTAYTVWRVRASGSEEPEPLTVHPTNVKYVTPIDARTVLFVAPDEDKSGPWLWGLDVPTKVVHRVNSSLDRYLSVATDADGRRLVATIAKSTSTLWSVPILDQVAKDEAAKPYLPGTRAFAPRLGDGALYYLSSNGSGKGDRLWRRVEGNPPVSIRTDPNGALLGAPAVSPDGRIALVVPGQRKSTLRIITADGDSRTIADDIDVRGTAAWSADSRWIFIGGADREGPGLFKILVDGGRPTPLVRGLVFDPASSRDGLIVYAEVQGATAPLRAVRADGSAVANFPEIYVMAGGGGRVRFLPDGRLVYLQGSVGMQEFRLLDLATGKKTLIAQLSSPATVYAFDVTPDGKQIVFDRTREESEIRVIDLANRRAQ